MTYLEHIYRGIQKVAAETDTPVKPAGAGATTAPKLPTIQGINIRGKQGTSHNSWTERKGQLYRWNPGNKLWYRDQDYNKVVSPEQQKQWNQQAQQRALTQRAPVQAPRRAPGVAPKAVAAAPRVTPHPILKGWSNLPGGVSVPFKVQEPTSQTQVGALPARLYDGSQATLDRFMQGVLKGGTPTRGQVLSGYYTMTNPDTLQTYRVPAHYQYNGSGWKYYILPKDYQTVLKKDRNRPRQDRSLWDILTGSRRELND